MFGIGLPELILILALALIVVGPDKLPDLARSIAKTIVDLKKTAEGFKESINEESNPLSDIKPELEDAAKKFRENVLDVDMDSYGGSGDLKKIENLDDESRDLLSKTMAAEQEVLSAADTADHDDRDQEDMNSESSENRKTDPPPPDSRQNQ